MGRAIGGAVVGYVVDFLAMFALMTAAWFAVGAKGAFLPGVWQVTTLWIVLLLVAAFASGFAGGMVTGKIDASGLGAKILAGLIVAFGIVFALPILTGSLPVPELPRPDALPMLEAMGKGQQPTWSALVIPLLGATGALLGGRRKAG